MTSKYSNSCRLCLSTEGFRVFLYGDENDGKNFERKIRTCLSIQISQDEPLPKQICYQCVYKLNTLDDFRKDARVCDKILKSYFFPEVHENEKQVTSSAGVSYTDDCILIDENPLEEETDCIYAHKSAGKDLTNNSITSTQKSCDDEHFLAESDDECCIVENEGLVVKDNVMSPCKRNANTTPAEDAEDMHVKRPAVITVSSPSLKTTDGNQGQELEAPSMGIENDGQLQNQRLISRQPVEEIQEVPCKGLETQKRYSNFKILPTREYMKQNQMHKSIPGTSRENLESLEEVAILNPNVRNTASSVTVNYSPVYYQDKNVDSSHCSAKNHSSHCSTKNQSFPVSSTPATTENNTNTVNVQEICPFSCVLCARKFPTRDHLKEHLTGMHGLNPSTPGTSSANQTANKLQGNHKRFLCKICKNTFPHHSEKSKDGDYICRKCTVTTQSKTHSETVTENADKIQEVQRKKVSDKIHSKNSRKSDQSFLCTICKEEFSLRVRLHQHIESHIKDDSNTCVKCNMQFSSRRDVKQHMKDVHSRAKKARCKLCGNSYANKHSLQRHMLKHKDKTFHCSQCNKRFVTSCEWRRHEESHLKSKKFVRNIFVSTTVIENEVLLLSSDEDT